MSRENKILTLLDGWGLAEIYTSLCLFGCKYLSVIPVYGEKLVAQEIERIMRRNLQYQTRVPK